MHCGLSHRPARGGSWKVSSQRFTPTLPGNHTPLRESTPPPHSRACAGFWSSKSRGREMPAMPGIWGVTRQAGRGNWWVAGRLSRAWQPSNRAFPDPPLKPVVNFRRYSSCRRRVWILSARQRRADTSNRHCRGEGVKGRYRGGTQAYSPAERSIAEETRTCARGRRPRPSRDMEWDPTVAGSRGKAPLPGRNQPWYAWMLALESQ